jgi:hypothetical protein
MACLAQVHGLHPEHDAVGARMWVVAGEAGDLAFGEWKSCYGHLRDNIDLDSMQFFPVFQPSSGASSHDSQ